VLRSKALYCFFSAELHKIPAHVHCTVQVCSEDWRTCTPHHTVAGRSSISLTQSPFPFPSATAAAHPLSATCQAVPLHPYALASRQIICLSHMPGRAVALFACVQAELHTSSHTVRCARLVHLCFSVIQCTIKLLLLALNLFSRSKQGLKHSMCLIKNILKSKFEDSVGWPFIAAATWTWRCIKIGALYYHVP
jgi:hypothetical protein